MNKRSRNSALIRNENGFKECNYCLQWLPESEYYKSNTLTLDGLQTSCKICQTVYKYGLNRNDIEQLLKEQNNKCPICLKPLILQSNDFNKRWCLDHDHECCPHKSACIKCVRGILCWDCNIGISKFGDDTYTLQRAVNYLRKTNND